MRLKQKKQFKTVNQFRGHTIPHVTLAWN